MKYFSATILVAINVKEEKKSKFRQFLENNRKSDNFLFVNFIPLDFIKSNWGSKRAAHPLNLVTRAIT